MSSVTSRVTVTGARAATGSGMHVTHELAADLAREPRIIVAGGAYGVDAAAHAAALATGRASTIAVLSTGLDRPYPIGHDGLFRRVTDSGGVLVSEMPPGASPTRSRFLARARLLATLSGATVIPEAGSRSMALTVAARAFDLGRKVGAIPGPITSPASVGCHRLLQDGVAQIVTRAEDVVRMLDPTLTVFRRGLADLQAAQRATPEDASARRPAL